MHSRNTHRILWQLSGKGNGHLEEVKASEHDWALFPLITFESAYKPSHPRETGFTITWSHIFFTPNLALNFPLSVPKSQIQGQRFMPWRLLKWVSDLLKAPQQKHSQWLWAWDSKWSRCIVCIPSQQIILKTRPIGGEDCMVMDSNIQDQQEHKRVRQRVNVSLCPVKGGGIYSAGWCAHCGQIVRFFRRNRKFRCLCEFSRLQNFVYEIQKNNFFKPL